MSAAWQLAFQLPIPTPAYRRPSSRSPRGYVREPAGGRSEKITVPTIILRGHYDGIAGFADLIEFFKRPPNADKQFAMMRHMSHASLRLKNYRIIHHILACWFAQPEPMYRG
jgi:pimeloyl-ACP methyl ester carboxylesterase